MPFKRYPALVAFAVAIPAVSHAQLGSLARKAKDAAANKVENKVIENKKLKPSSAFGAELTPQSLDRVLRGLAAHESKLNDADGMREARQQIDAELAKSYTAHDKDRERFDVAHRKAEQCQDSVISTRGKASQDAYMKRMQTDPVAQAKMVQTMMAVSQKVNDAQMRGDSVEARRLMTDIAKGQGIDPKADSLVANKTCGAIPARPAWLVEQDTLRARSRRLDSQVREVEHGAQAAGAAASGMPVKEYSLGRERVMHWHLESRGGKPIQAFGIDERKLLESRRADIETFKKALQ
jgi:hypothetical protein